MAAVFSTGPVHMAIANNTGPATPLVAAVIPAAGNSYYGTTQTGPDITEEPSYFNVMNDLAGPNLPLSRGYAGSEHTITLVMTRWDGTIDLFLNNGPVPVVNTGGTGSEGPTTRGRLDVGVQIMMILSNGPIVAPVDAVMPFYRRYFRCIPIGPNKPIFGNKENIRVRVFKAQNVFNAAGFALPLVPGARAWALFDEGPTLPAPGFPTPTII